MKWDLGSKKLNHETYFRYIYEIIPNFINL